MTIPVTDEIMPKQYSLRNSLSGLGSTSPSIQNTTTYLGVDTNTNHGLASK
jgi:hypothetical protein